MSDAHIVIVGGGHGGVQVAARLREYGWRGRLTIIDSQGQIPYERPPLSKELLKIDSTETRPPLLRQAAYYDRVGIQLLTGTCVARVDRGSQRVYTYDGLAIDYSHLVIATGCGPRRLDVPGHALAGVHLLRTYTDALALSEQLVAGRRLIVIGAGYVGMEVAAACKNRGVEVTIVESQDRVMKRVTSPTVSDFFQRLHQSAGVSFALQTGIGRFVGQRTVSGVETTNGDVLPADLVLVGIGVIPRDQLARDADLPCHDGVLVDENCRTEDPLIYAVGDVARFPLPGHGMTRLECIQSAVHHSDRVARHIVGMPAGKWEIPWFWSIQYGVRLQTAGLRLPRDEEIIRGDPASGKFSVLYLRDGYLAAIDTVGSLKDFAPAKRLIRAGAPVDRLAVADQERKLADAVATFTQQGDN